MRSMQEFLDCICTSLQNHVAATGHGILDCLDPNAVFHSVLTCFVVE